MTVALGMPAPRALPAHLSYSQVSTFTDCGERYRLERVYGLRGVPSWAQVGGTAFHTATEALDRFELAPVLDYAQLRDVVFPRLGNAGGTDSSTRAHAPLESFVTEIIETLTDLSLAVDRNELSVDVGTDGLPTTVPPQITALWNASFDEAIRQEQQRNPGLADPKDWRAAGRKSKAWPAAEDRAWWNATGPLMLGAYVHWRATSGWMVATVDSGETSVPAVEMNVSGSIGDVRVEAYLDVVYLDPGSMPILCDKKTSAQEPASDEQLGLYKVLLEQQGLPVRYGTYYVARKGAMGSLRDLSRYSLDYFSFKYGDVRDRRNAGKFLPNPASTLCKICGVRDYCRAVGGKNASMVPPVWSAPKPLLKESNTK